MPVSWLVEGCKAPKPEWRGNAALAVLAVNPELAAYPYATDEWTRETGKGPYRLGAQREWHTRPAEWHPRFEVIDHTFPHKWFPKVEYLRADLTTPA